MGGARPKNVVEDGEGLWLAKFPDPGDRWSNARVEGAMLALAAECGIHSATHRTQDVAGKDVLLVKRFDRTRTDEGYLRHRMVSGLTLLGAEGHVRRSRQVVVPAARRRAAPAQLEAVGGPAGALPADGVQRAHLEHG